MGVQDSARPCRHQRRRREPAALSRLRRRRIHHRPDHQHRWRHVHELTRQPQHSSRKVVPMAGQRRLLIAANWKMNLTHHEAAGYLESFSGELAEHDTAAVEIALLPPFTALHAVQAFIHENNVPIAYGAQDLSPFANGPYTGDVAGPMLSSLGCTYALVGPSERRQHHAEDDSTVHAKAQAA